MMAPQDQPAWLDAWKRAWDDQDLGAFMTHYAPDVVLTSPSVRTRFGVADATLHGIAAVREHFRVGWRLARGTQFQIDGVLWGVDGCTVRFTRDDGEVLEDVLILDGDGRIREVRTYYATAPEGS
jgi:hypothetical protein